MVFDHKNAWANIQRKGRDLSYVEIDLNNSKLWKPFFTPDFTRDMDTCQKDENGGRELKYFQPNMKVPPTHWSTCSPHVHEQRPIFTNLQPCCRIRGVTARRRLTSARSLSTQLKRTSRPPSSRSSRAGERKIALERRGCVLGTWFGR